MDIDLSVLRMMEREKEIPFDELVEIIEQAILMAYLKHTNPGQHGHANPAGARAHLDRKTGHVSVYVPELDEEVQPFDATGTGERFERASEHRPDPFAVEALAVGGDAGGEGLPRLLAEEEQGGVAAQFVVVGERGERRVDVVGVGQPFGQDRGLVVHAGRLEQSVARPEDPENRLDGDLGQFHDRGKRARGERPFARELDRSVEDTDAGPLGLLGTGPHGVAARSFHDNAH